MIENEVKKACEVLSNSGIILYPTDTVWGIGCNANDDKAIEKIYKLKQRSDSKAMIILVDSVDMASKYVKELPSLAPDLWNLTNKPLTLVLPNGTGVSDLILPEEKTIAIRVTSNLFCKKLIAKTHQPLVSTSANISGHPSAVHLQDVSNEILSGVDYVVDKSMEAGATCAPSSIMSLGLSGEIKILRQ